MLLSARVPVTACPRRVRVCLVLVALEQSSDRGPVSFFLWCNRIGNLPGTYHARALECCSSSTQQYETATTGARMLLESSVARVLLSVVVVAAADCSGVLVTRWPQDMITRCIHHVHTW